MKIFILGTSYSGKTPVAERLGSCLGFPVYSAGQWARQGLLTPCVNMTEYVKEVTEFSLCPSARFPHRTRVLADAM